MIYPPEKLALWHDTNFMNACIGQLSSRKAVSIYASTSNGDVCLKNIYNYVFFSFGNVILSTKEQKTESYKDFQNYISKPRLEFILVLCSSL